jgi:hypothetical protein
VPKSRHLSISRVGLCILRTVARRSDSPSKLDRLATLAVRSDAPRVGARPGHFGRLMPVGPPRPERALGTITRQRPCLDLSLIGSGNIKSSLDLSGRPRPDAAMPQRRLGRSTRSCSQAEAVKRSSRYGASSAVGAPLISSAHMSSARRRPRVTPLCVTATYNPSTPGSHPTIG